MISKNECLNPVFDLLRNNRSVSKLTETQNLVGTKAGFAPCMPHLSFRNAGLPHSRVKAMKTPGNVPVRSTVVTVV